MTYFMAGFLISTVWKLTVRPSNATLVRATLRTQPVSVARITYAELAASIARAWRLDAITVAQRDAILARLAADFAHMNIVEIRAALVALVPDLVMRHPLRGYDAVQLAAALTVRTSGMAVEFWSSDVGLCQAAATEGLRVVNPN